MTPENLTNIKKLARLKTELNKLPDNSLLALRAANEFLDLYKAFETQNPQLQRSEIDALVLREIKNLM